MSWKVLHAIKPTYKDNPPRNSLSECLAPNLKYALYVSQASGERENEDVIEKLLEDANIDLHPVALSSSIGPSISADGSFQLTFNDFSKV